MRISDLSPQGPETDLSIIATTELICFSHLRWDFVFQRPQHLLTRLSRTMRVWYIEEPDYTDQTQPSYTIQLRPGGVKVVVPQIPKGLAAEDELRFQKELFDNFMLGRSLAQTTFWYYTPMALAFTRHYTAAVTVYDCMDELSAFKFAPVALKVMEKELLTKADIVFTGGVSLYEAKKTQHHNIHAFPSSIDKKHFGAVRTIKADAGHQCSLADLQVGFYGVIDERFDIDLIREMADLRPNWQIMLIGPVVKIDPATLPKRDNIHYLGAKTYDQLPDEMAKWDIALIPFLLNESTRFISPTKTPEYLAAGLPVVSTAITDVKSPYGDLDLLSIANDAKAFVEKAELEIHRNRAKWLKDVDRFLSLNSWDLTALKMQKLMSEALTGADRSLNELGKKYV